MSDTFQREDLEIFAKDLTPGDKIRPGGRVDAGYAEGSLDHSLGEACRAALAAHPEATTFYFDLSPAVQRPERQRDPDLLHRVTVALYRIGTREAAAAAEGIAWARGDFSKDDGVVRQAIFAASLPYAPHFHLGGGTFTAVGLPAHLALKLGDDGRFYVCEAKTGLAVAGKVEFRGDGSVDFVPEEPK